ncbi:DUF5808 domain-containing protein [Aminipila terrae]|uniref:DUF5808 domain-containing protein n=1 Tax=Aminipila terrae TaxID=2697030 RepID=A0A6P1ML26_9FIRM|nr:DUF5808 domain-containing protein [Aminipila terrae]QHI71685.1 hypothetical protein Ami3637_04180 [Aminipila terrae]
MLQSLLILTWIVFATMTVNALFYKNYRDYQVLGVTLSRAHAKAPEVEELIKKFKTKCYLTLILFIGFSFLMLIKDIQAYAEFCMLILVMTNLLANWCVIHHYQKKLQRIKQENAWIYPKNKVVTVDMNVSKEKGKSSVSPVWNWVFFILSFLPSIFLVVNPEARQYYPIGFSFIGPLCQLSMVYLYYQMKSQHAPVLSEDTEVNKACARTEERVNSKAATLFAFIMLVFWILFNISMVYLENGTFIISPVIILIAGLLIITNWHQKKIRSLEEYFYDETLQNDNDMVEQECTWKWGCYYNPNDKRIIVPKRMASMGWTINIGNPAGKAIGIGFIALMVIVLGIVLYGGSKDYIIKEQGSKLVIDAAMYDMNIEKNQIVYVSKLDKIPEGHRINGYGGINKSFGHFSVNGYGNCMFYVYNNVEESVVVKLKGKYPEYVIMNGKSLAETDILYRDIRKWMAE